MRRTVLRVYVTSLIGTASASMRMLFCAQLTTSIITQRSFVAQTFVPFALLTNQIQEVFISNGILAPELARKKDIVRLSGIRRGAERRARPPVDFGENGYGLLCCVRIDLLFTCPLLLATAL